MFSEANSLSAPTYELPELRIERSHSPGISVTREVVLDVAPSDRTHDSPDSVKKDVPNFLQFSLPPNGRKYLTSPPNRASVQSAAPFASVEPVSPHYAPSWIFKSVPTEPNITAPEFLFKYGFFIPAFWLLGALYLFAHTTPATLKNMAEEDKEYFGAERMWAKRCLWASCALVGVGMLVTIIVLAVLVSKS
ncbi:hypothetical protein FISHEDRAFT_72871 [Fistulina hepatica ATCC 64428]|nr:hypothetical protein FISHEDRAFT_72871 [Fistulina hepatica ATCC 64428]